MTTDVDVEADLDGQRELADAVARLNQGVEPDPEAAVEPEQVTDEVEAVAETGQDESAGQDSDEEAKARADGWVSKEEWVASGKPADKWKPAEEFNRHGAMYALHKGDLVAKIDEQVRITQEMARVLRQQQEEAVRRAREEERNRVEEEMRDAWTRGDMDQYNKAHAKSVAIDNPAPAGPPSIDPAIKEWGDRNPWFTSGFDELGLPVNPAAAEMAELTARYRQFRPNEPAINAVLYAEKRVKEKYADMFKPKAPPRATAPAVASAGRGSDTKPASPHMKAFSSKSAAEQAIIRQMAKASGMTIEQYMKDY